MGAGDVAARLLVARPWNESAEPDYSVQLALLAAIVASSDDAIVSMLSNIRATVDSPVTTADSPVTTADSPVTTTDSPVATADSLVSTTDSSVTTADGPGITADGPAPARLKILVVDDNRDAADSCAAMLEVVGHRVEKAYSGQRALELAEPFRPDAFLLDIGLPDLDGYELARKIRSLPWGHTTALIAVTGWGQDEHRRRALVAGFDRHLTKPIAPEALSALLQSLATKLPVAVERQGT